MEKKTLEQCKQEIAEKYEVESFEDLFWSYSDSEGNDGFQGIDRIYNESAELYANQFNKIDGNKNLKPLAEMTFEDFSEIFDIGFSKPFAQENINLFNSLYGFHNAISKYGKFESHRLAIELGYDVEFTLSS